MILLDTHVLLMLALAPERLSRAARRAILKAEAGPGMAIASITLWEVAQLASARRVTIVGSIETFLGGIVQRPGLAVLEITPEIAALTVQSPTDFPKDPAARIIAATARAHALPLVTRDERLQGSKLLRTIW
jgi:PIN domain nuclease of toxin-antitoxin system